MSDWQPIESAPQDSTEILLCAGPPEKLGPGHIKWKYGVGFYSKSMGLGHTLLWDWPWRFPPTHWQPLNPPSVARPTSDGGGNG